MTFSLYDLTVPTYLQALGAVAGAFDKWIEHAKAGGFDGGDIVETRLAPDINPFRFQINAMVFHSLGAVETLKAGTLVERPEPPEQDAAGLIALLADTRASLQAVAREEIEALADREIALPRKDKVLRFTAPEFVLSFSLPNFYFHSTVAYSALRTRGAPLRKEDFLGKLRTKG